MAEQENAENIVFLPWTVEPQPQTQAVILQQPSETHLRLDATTDKTAIASFVAATVVGIIAAIWYGQKSFKLTEMSFKIVSQEIEEAAQSHRETAITMFEQQKALKEIDYKLTRTLEFEKQFHEKIALYLSNFSSFRQRLIMQIASLSTEELARLEKGVGIFDHQIVKDIHKCYEKLIRLTIEMSFLVNMKNEKVKELFSLMNDFNKGILMLSVRVSKGKNSVHQKISELQDQKDQIHIKALHLMQHLNTFNQ